MRTKIILLNIILIVVSMVLSYAETIVLYKLGVASNNIQAIVFGITMLQIFIAAPFLNRLQKKWRMQEIRTL